MMNFKLNQQQEFVRKMVKVFENENIAEKIVKENNDHGSAKSKEEKEVNNAKANKDAI